jgi:DNA-binding PadR family transcriptional regulator
LLLLDPAREMYGLELVRAAGLATGTIHPILARLEACGWLESRWEDLDPHAAGRPRRRYYRLSPDGVVGAARAVDRRASVAARPQRLPGGVVAEGST